VAFLVVPRERSSRGSETSRPLLLDFWQSLRGTRSPSPQVVIVGVDEKSIARFGPPAWPRSQYAPLVERLSQAGAKVIGFDFTFGALEREAENNRVLADAMKKAGNVVFGYEFTRVGDLRGLQALRANAIPRVRTLHAAGLGTDRAGPRWPQSPPSPRRPWTDGGSGSPLIVAMGTTSTSLALQMAQVF
jgi:CHASE2 domain-containing sensor protein